VNWNAGAALRRCVEAVLASDGGDPQQVIVVDNASTDGSLLGLASMHPAIEIIRNARNVGYARAVNQGLRASRGQYAVVLNPDVVLQASALSQLIHFMGTHPDAGLAGPRLFDADGRVQGSARRDPSAWTGLFGRAAPLTRLFPGNPISRRELPALTVVGDEAVRVDWVSGACIVARRTAWEQAGPLDERFFLFWEDADWGRRIRQAGWSVYYVPSARGTHVVGVSRAGRRLASVVDFHLSAHRYYCKHHGISRLHPRAMLVGAGLLGSLVLRMVQASWPSSRGSSAPTRAAS
jgi:hypothetical protein